MSEHIKPIFKGVKKSLNPLFRAVGNTTDLEYFLRNFGWEANFDGTNISVIQSAFNLNSIWTQVEDLLKGIEAASLEVQIERSLEAVSLIKQITSAVVDFKNKQHSSLTSLPAPFDKKELWEEMGDYLPDLLLINYGSSRILVEWQ